MHTQCTCMYKKHTVDFQVEFLVFSYIETHVALGNIYTSGLKEKFRITRLLYLLWQFYVKTQFSCFRQSEGDRHLNGTYTAIHKYLYTYENMQIDTCKTVILMAISA